MSAIAHTLEKEGVATTSLSLIREHTASMRPPRALWVPFELGRPLGAPGDAEFQRDVVRAALALLERNDGPVILEDYPKDAPDGAAAETMEGLACPVALPRPEAASDPDRVRAILAEIAALAPWYELARESHGGRTSVGLSGLDIEAAVRLLGALLEDGAAPGGEDGRSPGERMRAAMEDVRNWYLEAAGARPGGSAGSRALADWFWGETEAGRLFLALHGRCSESEDASLRDVARFYLVPRAQQHRLKRA